MVTALTKSDLGMIGLKNHDGPESQIPLSWDRARVLAHAAPNPLRSLAVPLSSAVGCTLAEELRAIGPLPAFDTAAMDGLAVSGQGPWRVRGQVRAGAVWAGVLDVGECVEISTGAQVPAGATSVLPVESATQGSSVVYGSAGVPGTHIRRAGEDAASGMMLAPAGSRIAAALIGLAAKCGYDRVVIRPQPRLRVMVTGDEVTSVRHMPDTPIGALATAIGEFAADCDTEVLVVSGSTSVGTTDQLLPALRASGAKWVVGTVACRPGHPVLLASVGSNRWVVGLPGNPFAALVGAHTVLGPLLTGLMRGRLLSLPRVPVTGEAGTAKKGVTRLVPGAVGGWVSRDSGWTPGGLPPRCGTRRRVRGAASRMAAARNRACCPDLLSGCGVAGAPGNFSRTSTLS